MEQLAAGHIEPSNSPWNTPIFVIKKKSRKWRIVTRFQSYKRNYGRHGGPPARPPFPSGCAFSVQCDSYRSTGLFLYRSPGWSRLWTVCLQSPFRWASLVAQRLKHLPPIQDTRVRSLGQEDPQEKEILQYSCLENPMDGETWQATVHGVSKTHSLYGDIYFLFFILFQPSRVTLH